MKNNEVKCPTYFTEFHEKASEIRLNDSQNEKTFTQKEANEQTCPFCTLSQQTNLKDINETNSKIEYEEEKKLYNDSEKETSSKYDDCKHLDTKKISNKCHEPENKAVKYKLRSALLPKQPKKYNKKIEKLSSSTKENGLKSAADKLLSRVNMQKTALAQQKPLIGSSTSSSRKQKNKEVKQLEVDEKVYILQREKRKKIDWKQDPRYQVKQTATSKLRHNYWFTDCGKQKVKAFRGDWLNFPPELMKDWEIYENYFKYRRKPLSKESSLVKKIVSGKLVPKKRKNGKRPFTRRSPMLQQSSLSSHFSRLERRRRKPKIDVGYSQEKRTHLDVLKKPLIEVKDTVTSRMRHNSLYEPCSKPGTSTFWHGSNDEIEELKQKIALRKSQFKDRWKEQLSTTERQSYDMNRLMVTNLRQQSKVADKCKVVELKTENTIQVKRTDPTHKPCKTAIDNKIVNHTEFGNSNIKKMTIKNCKWQPTATVELAYSPNTRKDFKPKEGVTVSGCSLATVKSPKATYIHRKIKKRKSCLGLRKLHHVAKWMMPSTLPIQTNLTSNVKKKAK
ncbi:hypothetical protein PGB90_001893 [Kerria lacca]